MAMERKRSFGAMLITAPSDHERVYEMAVRVTSWEMRPLPGYALFPWIRITADVETGEVQCAAGVKAKRIGE